MSHKLERFLIWFGAIGAGAALMYGALVGLTSSATPIGVGTLAMLGVALVVGGALLTVGLLGFAIEIVNWVNRALPDAVSVVAYERAVEQPLPPPESRSDDVPTVRPVPQLRPKPGSPKGRLFVDVTHEYLIGLFKDKLGIQANKLIAPYIGKWMRVSGGLGDVLGDDTLLVTLDGQQINQYLYMFFDKTWRDRLSVLRPGQSIHVIGQIDRVDPISVNLRKCELVDVQPS